MRLSKNKLNPLALLTLCVGLSGFGNISQADNLNLRKTSNVALGHAIYTDMQGDSLQAMSMVMAANAKRQLGDDAFLARMFLADKLVKRGLPKYALALYQNVGNKAKKTRTRDQAWLHYAQISMELGQYEVAQRSLAKIVKSLKAPQRADRKLIEAHALLAKGKINQAIAVLPNIRDDSLWALYQRYNLGIKLLGDLGNKHGAVILHELANLETDDNPEILALKDQTNLAIGFSLLRLNKPKKARHYLEHVRLNGPMSNMALLGMGWSYSTENNHEQALVFWLELQRRPLANAYSYESLLAVPYALGKAEAYNQATKYYDSAKTRFESEIQAIDASIKAINQGKLITLINTAPSIETEWLKNWQAVPTAAESRFLPLLMDNPAFQIAMKEYRTLLQLSAHTKGMADEIEDLNHRPAAKNNMADIGKLHIRYSDISKKLDAITQTQQTKLIGIALNTLERYKKQLENYILQAILGKAQVLEQASLAQRIQ